jgi:menaquinone-dependent protoporphyrinogen oxidase
MIEGTVSLLNVADVTSELIGSADKIILGSPVYSGKLRKDMANLINQFKSEFSEKECGMYVCSVNEFKTMNYLEQAISKGFISNLVEVVYAGYGLAYDKMTFIEKLAVKAMIKKDSSKQSINTTALEKLVKKLY